MSNADLFNLCGTTIDGKYRVLSVVGEGGFGVVYKGFHEGFNAPVAIKCLKLPAHFAVDAQEALVQQLREEGRLLLRLSQRTPGILQALDVGSFITPWGARVPYLVLEWLDGRTLADEIRGRSGMPLHEAVAMLDPAARALAVAHSEKIAHRDIKPENMFCIVSGGTPSIKILDFGIAKLLGEAASPLSGTAVGAPSMFTPAYGAPEQFDKRRGATGPWTDVFALALVLVEMVTGAPALQGDTVFDLYNASINPGARPSLRGRGIAAPPAVDAVLAKALHPDPMERYPEVGAFWSALGAAMAETRGPAADFVNAKTVAAPMPMPPPIIESIPTAASVPTAASALTAGSGVAGVPMAPLPMLTGASGVVTGKAVTATKPTRASHAALLWISLAVIVVPLGGLIGWRASHTRARASRQTSLSVPPGASAHEAAMPISSNPAAAALYKDAMQAWHDGSLAAAIHGMKQAIWHDHELGAAQIRLAIWQFMAGTAGGKQVEARKHYQAATLIATAWARSTGGSSTPPSPTCASRGTWRNGTSASKSLRRGSRPTWRFWST